MAKIDAAKLWSLHYQMMTAVLASVQDDIAALGLEAKELFVLAEIDAHPHPAELATTLCMPKPTVTVYLKRLEGAGLVRRELDAKDLRKHRLSITASGRKVLTRGLALLSEAFGSRLTRLSASEQTELRALIEKLV